MPETVVTLLCTTCKVEKSLTEFYKSTLKTGSYKCKQCNRIYQRNYHNETFYPKHEKRHHRYRKEYALEYSRRPEVVAKRRARITLIHAINKGEIKRPDHCDRCELPCKPNAHHHKGYEGANVFDVQWLCFPCHKFIHRLKPNESQSSTYRSQDSSTSGLNGIANS